MRGVYYSASNYPNVHFLLRMCRKLLGSEILHHSSYRFWRDGLTFGASLVLRTLANCALTAIRALATTSDVII